MDRQELLYDHYKDTCELQRSSLTSRNKLFAVVVVLIGVLLLLAYRPDTIGGVFVAFIKRKYGADVASSLGILQSLIWAAILYTSVRYYQVSIYIERTYNYIHSLEKRISTEIEDEFNREGDSYLNNYPRCSDAINFLYKWMFPILYILALLIKIISEAKLSFGFFFDVIVCAIAVMLCVLYISFNFDISKGYKVQDGMVENEKKST